MGDDDRADLRGVDGVRRLAELAALELTDAEAERLAGELDDILAHFEALRAVGGAEEAEEAEGAERAEYAERSAEGASVDGVAGPGVGAPRAPLRPDEPGADPLARAPAADAPAFEDGFFTVPRLASHAGGADNAERAEGAAADVTEGGEGGKGQPEDAP